MKNGQVLAGFFVLEGLDGSGTTTQCRMLSERLKRVPVPHWLTCEPSSGAVGSLIRKALKGDPDLTPHTLARLFAADRHEHLYGKDGVESHLAAGESVICDRYTLSSLAYQSVQCDPAQVAEWNRHFPFPQLTVFLDVPVDVAFDRVVKRGGNPEIFEHREFQHKVCALYEKALASYGGPVQRIDGCQPPEIIARELWTCLGFADIYGYEALQD